MTNFWPVGWEWLQMQITGQTLKGERGNPPCLCPPPFTLLIWLECRCHLNQAWKTACKGQNNKIKGVWVLVNLTEQCCLTSSDFVMRKINFFFFKGELTSFLKKFIYFWLHWVFIAARGLLSCGEWGLLFASSHCGDFSCCGAWALGSGLRSCGTPASLPWGTCTVPRPGVEPVSPALAGRLWTTREGQEKLVFSCISLLFSVSETWSQAYTLAGAEVIWPSSCQQRRVFRNICKCLGTFLIVSLEGAEVAVGIWWVQIKAAVTHPRRTGHSLPQQEKTV